MSVKELERFTKEMEEQAALKAEVMALGTDLEAICALAREKGYDISLEDLPQAEGDLVLSDEELDGVAAGTFLFRR